jgi:hypothetical protein
MGMRFGSSRTQDVRPSRATGSLQSARAVEQVGLGVQVIGLAAQAAPDHLLAQKLGAKGADAEYVGHRIRVPAFGEHRHWHDAADLLTEPARTADGITSRSNSLSLASPCAAPAPSRAASSRLNRSISGPAASRKPLSSASPASIWRESISSVRGRGRRAPWSS